jgi:hypothetical protein
MRRSVGIALVFCASLVCGLPALAECMIPGKAPVPPNGATATVEEMKQGHDQLQSYVNQLEAYQACLEAEIKAAPADADKELKNAWRAQGNAAVDLAQELQTTYAAQIQVFKARGGH